MMCGNNRLGIGKRYSMILRKILFLILVSALSFVPILQAAHALTHVGEADIPGIAEADGHQGEDPFAHCMGPFGSAPWCRRVGCCGCWGAQASGSLVVSAHPRVMGWAMGSAGRVA